MKLYIDQMYVSINELQIWIFQKQTENTSEHAAVGKELISAWQT